MCCYITYVVRILMIIVLIPLLFSISRAYRIADRCCKAAHASQYSRTFNWGKEGSITKGHQLCFEQRGHNSGWYGKICSWFFNRIIMGGFYRCWTTEICYLVLHCILIIVIVGNTPYGNNKWTTPKWQKGNSLRNGGSTNVSLVILELFFFTCYSLKKFVFIILVISNLSLETVFSWKNFWKL